MKRKAAQSKHSSEKHTAESSSALQDADQGILYEEATGKTVDFIRYAEQSRGWPAFEIRFTDGTFLFVEPIPQVQFQGSSFEGKQRKCQDHPRLWGHPN